MNESPTLNLLAAIAEQARADTDGIWTYRGDVRAPLRAFHFHKKRAKYRGHWVPVRDLPAAPYCRLTLCDADAGWEHYEGECGAAFLDYLRAHAPTDAIEAAHVALRLAA